MKELSTRALFTEYVHIVNQVLGSNRERPMFRPIVEAAETVLSDRRLGVGVYTDDPDAPDEWFTTSLEGDTFRILAFGEEEVDWRFRVARQHLETVVQNRSEFIARPYKLDLDWLTTRIESLTS